MNAPLKPDGSNFPCKLYHEDFGTSPAGDPTATWAAGSPQKITLDGEATHNGGSCQLSLSYDQGKTFRVIKSIEGSCAGNGNKFDFTVPADAKSGDAIFAWTWFNHTGNREMYMNCAAVTITGSGTSTLEDRPEIFTANINNDCKTTEGTDVVFPNPGPDLQVLSDANLGPPSGQGCEAPSSPAPAPEESGDPTDPDQPTGSVDPTESVDPTSSVNATKTKEPVSTSKSKAPTSTSDAPASTSTSPTGTEYVVKSGDICVNIAEQQGVSLSTLFQLNPEVYVLAFTPVALLSDSSV